MELWKDCVENANYEVSNKGRVRRKVSFVPNNINGGRRQVGGKPLSPKKKSNGYLEVQLYYAPNCGRMHYVHRLVASAFIDEIKEGLEVNHKNGIRHDNQVSNLEVVTPSENRKHSVRELGFRPPSFRGENHPNAGFKKSEVLEIRRLYASGFTASELAERYSSYKNTINKIVQRVTWAHI